MNKNLFYFTLLTLVLGSVLYYQFQISQSKLKKNPYYTNQQALKNSNYLDGFFFEKYYNEKQPSSPFVALVKGSEFLFHFESNDSTLFYRVVEDSPADKATVKVEMYELNVKIKNDREYALLIEAQGLREVIGKGTVTTLSKQEITATAHSCDEKMALVVILTKTDTWLLDWKYSPIGGVIGLLFLSIFIWCVRFLSSFIGGILGVTESAILGVLVVGLVLLTTLEISRHLIESKANYNNIWDVFLSVYGLYNFMPIGLFILFKYLIKKYKSRREFLDLEFGKYVFIGTAWMLLVHLQLLFLALSYEDHSKFYYSNLSLSGALTGAILFATANFLNNFRAHYFQLRKQGKSLVQAQTNQLQSKSELAALQSRVNPHFLYNSLNSIASLAESDSVRTKDMALALSEFYKYSTNRKDEAWTTIDEEIQMVKKYLEIEKIRFGDKLNTSIEADGELGQVMIPKFLIQPIVENAIKYGYCNELDQIDIQIDIASGETSNQVTISVMDSGPDFPEDMDSGYGISSVQKKLKLTFPEHALSFNNKRRSVKGVRMKEVVILLTNPKRHEEGDNS